MPLRRFQLVVNWREMETLRGLEFNIAKIKIWSRRGSTNKPQAVALIRHKAGERVSCNENKSQGPMRLRNDPFHPDMREQRQLEPLILMLIISPWLKMLKRSEQTEEKPIRV